MKYFCASISIVFLLSNHVIAQLEIQGQVIDAISQKPVPYVNIGILTLGVGTVSSEDGYFEIAIKESYADDSLLFYSLGYAQRYCSIKDLKTGINLVQLQEVIQVLPEVDVHAVRLEQKLLGYKVKSMLVKGGFGSKWLGSEVGAKIKIKGKRVLLEEFYFHIAANTFDSVTFRLNIYSIKNDLPSSKVLYKNLIVTTKIKEGQEVIDLRPFDLVLDHDFIIALEWIAKHGDQDPGVVLFPFGLLKGKSYFRKTSHSNWETNRNLGVAFQVLVSQ